MTAQRHVIKKLPVDTARSGWEAIAHRLFPPQSLEAEITADWLVVGAGFGGLAAARRLTQTCPGARIVLLDATQLALGPAGRNSGYMIDVPHNISGGGYVSGGAEQIRAEMALNRLAIGFSCAAAAEYGMSPQTLDPSGKINAAASDSGEKHNADFARGLAQIGEPHESLDAAQMRALTGTDYYRSGLYTPGAVLIEPASFVYAYAAGLRPKVEIYESSPVLELNRDQSLWRARTPNGAVTAPKVILAVNGHIQNFGFFKGRLMHVFTYASMTAPFRAKAGQDRWALLPADPMGATVRKISHADGSRIVFRSRYTYNASLETSQACLDRLVRSHRKGFDARFPDLAGLPFDHTWGGRLCLSRNSAPAFGEVEDGLYSACCENGLGTVKSTLAGLMAADLATGRGSADLDAFMNHPTPSRVPPEPFATIGATAMIRLQEYRAGREG
jgi:glycine/D-amino acid oxidase-like deaminating enzyme